MTAAYNNKSKKITANIANKLIAKTKWQYFDDPLISLTDSDRMEWTDDGEFLCLTESGIEDFESFIQSAEEASE